MITTVILNWKRSKNIINKILPKICDYKLINEIIISHGNKDTYFSTPKFKNVKHFYDSDLNPEWGVALRFYRATFAKNDCVLFIDDDKLPSEKYVNKLYDEFKKDTHSILGMDQRYLSMLLGYQNFRILPTDKKIVLTQVMMSNKKICKDFVKEKSIMNNIAIKGKPVWNGEDIFFNVLFIKNYDKKPKHVSSFGNIKKLNENFAISSSNIHRKYRRRFSRISLIRNKLFENEIIFLTLFVMVSIIVKFYN
jgi:hypothetical protein